MSDQPEMTCSDMADRLTEFMEGELDEADEAAALEHVASCNHCETVLAGTTNATELARLHGRPSLTDADRNRMLGAVNSTLDTSDQEQPDS